MSFVSLSDIHIHQSGDKGWQSLMAFAKHPLVQKATHVGLLGDIFDLMAGDHPAYLQRHREVFALIATWCQQGKTVYFAEGNHDMHLGGLFHRFTRDWDLATTKRFVLLRTDTLVNVDGKILKIGHGDRYNQNDRPYLRYMDFITKPLLAHVADNIMPYQILKMVGERASVKSRKYGSARFDEDNVREVFRRGVQEQTPSNVAVVVGGHSHVTDEFHWDGKAYLNNGYPPRSGVFAAVDSSGARLVQL